MKFTIEEIEKLTKDLMAGAAEEIPNGIEFIDEASFLKFFTAMSVYVIGISKFMDQINKRLENIELALFQKEDAPNA